MEVVGVDEAVLRRCLEQVLRVRGEELVDRCRRADQGGQARPRATAGSAHLLPRAGDGARVADADAASSAPMSMPSSSAFVATTPRTRPSRRPALDLAPLVRQVAAAVAADACAGSAGRRLERLAQVAQQDLDRGPRRANTIVWTPRADQPLGKPLRRSGAPTARMPSSSFTTGGLIEEDVLRPAGAPFSSTSSTGASSSALGVLARVGDRAPAQMKTGSSRRSADAPQAPEHVRDVAAEDAAVGVQLVDDDVAQVLEQLGPLRVVRQDRRRGACPGW